MTEKTKRNIDQQQQTSQSEGRLPWYAGWKVKDLVHPIIISRIRLFQASIVLLLLATAGYFVWEQNYSSPTGEEMVTEMVTAAGGMEAWNSLRNGQFTRTQYLYGETGEELSRKVQTFFFKKTNKGLRLLVKSETENGAEVWVGKDEEGHWATKGKQASDPRETARDLGMMCDSEFCQPSCATSMAFYRFSMPFKLTDYGVLPTFTGTAALGEMEANVLTIEFLPEVGKDRWVFFTDPNTQLIHKMEYHNFSDDGHSRPEGIFWSDHREQDGITFSHRWTRYWSNGQVMEEYIYSDVDFKTELPEALFDRSPNHGLLTDQGS